MTLIVVARIECDADGCLTAREGGITAGRLRYFLEREGWECARPDMGGSGRYDWCPKHKPERTGRHALRVVDSAASRGLVPDGS